MLSVDGDKSIEGGEPLANVKYAAWFIVRFPKKA